jgi:hypothetical protein
VNDSAARQAAPDWDCLAERLKAENAGVLYRPGDPLFGTLGVPKNHVYIGNRPGGIVCPMNKMTDRVPDRGKRGVEIAVKWAVVNGVRVTPYSNGHNYAGYSAPDSASIASGRSLLIDLSDNQLKQPVLTVEQTADGDPVYLLTTGAGTTNGDVYPWLRTHPVADVQRAIPTGRCPTVALGGLVLGGGIGFSDRKYGLTCDTLVSTTVVVPTREHAVVASEHENGDLFWACRGGAGNNFGIHVDFTFKTHEVPGNDELFCVFNLTWSVDQAWDIYQAFARLLRDPLTPDGLHLRFGIGTSGQSASEAATNANCYALGEFYGASEELKALFNAHGVPYARAAPADIQHLNFWDATDYTFASTPIYKWGGKSAIVSQDGLDKNQINACVEAMRNWPGSHNDDGAGIALFALGGAINQVDKTATAFWHRDSLFIMALESSWSDNDSPATAKTCTTWLKDLYMKVWPGGPDHCYQNFPDPDLSGWQTRYYGDNYEHNGPHDTGLRGVKSTYDPNAVFGYPQGVEPAG